MRFRKVKIFIYENYTQISWAKKNYIDIKKVARLGYFDLLDLA